MVLHMSTMTTMTMTIETTRVASSFQIHPEQPHFFAVAPAPWLKRIEDTQESVVRKAARILGYMANAGLPDTSVHGISTLT